MTLLLSLAALGALLLLASVVGQWLRRVNRHYPPVGAVPPRHSVTGPVYLGGSVRADLPDPEPDPDEAVSLEVVAMHQRRVAREKP